MGTSVTNTVAQTTNSYCNADITIEKCSHLEKGLYVGGLTGLVKKPGSSNNFDTFYHKGTLKVQQAPGAVGYLFGDMVKDGIYQQAYYHGPSAAASELTGRLAGNSTFEAAVEEGFQPYQGEAPLQFGQSKTYTVKELVPEGYEASYVTAGDHTIITNTRTKQPDTAEIVPLLWAVYGDRAAVPQPWRTSDAGSVPEIPELIQWKRAVLRGGSFL